VTTKRKNKGVLETLSHLKENPEGDPKPRITGGGVVRGGGPVKNASYAREQSSASGKKGVTKKKRIRWRRKPHVWQTKLLPQRHNEPEKTRLVTPQHYYMKRERGGGGKRGADQGSSTDLGGGNDASLAEGKRISKKKSI